MISELQIRNLALIEGLNLSFGKGLTVLSGETGAGKTVIIEALNLLLGARSDSSRVRAGCAEASVQGLFILTPELTKELIEITNGEDELLLSRKVTAEGKSRCYINGALTTVSQLTELGSRLVDIHGQHEHQSLFRIPLHLEFLDQFAGAEILAQQARFADLLDQRKKLARRSLELSLAENQINERRELLRYQIEEIDACQPQTDEDVHAETELERLRQHERLAGALTAALEKLADDDVGGLDLIQLADRQLETIAGLDPALASMREEVVAISAQLEEVVLSLKRYREANLFDAERFNWLEERVHQLRSLKKKYGGSLEAVFEYRKRAEEELQGFENAETEQITIDRALIELTFQLTEAGRRLRDGRRKAGDDLEKEVRQNLGELGMPEAKFAAVFNPEKADPESWRPTGFDEIEFFISPNKGEKLMPLAKIASGGEISRVMLALKTVLAEIDGIPLMVFDEIDSGIGGKTASQVGIKLATLARDHQIICVTHLPQIAVYADFQFHVAKTEKDGRTVTTVKALDKDERIAEITRMSGADDQSEIAARHVRELMKAAERGKSTGATIRA